MHSSGIKSGNCSCHQMRAVSFEDSEGFEVWRWDFCEVEDFLTENIIRIAVVGKKIDDEGLKELVSLCCKKVMYNVHNSERGQTNIL